MEEYQILEVDPQSIHQMDMIERTNVDMQVATAKQYPRDLKRSLNNAIFNATMDPKTAASCSYAVPRGKGHVTGPSVHLAKIIAQCYGNMRVESKVVDITDKQIVSRGTAWDLENNLAVAFEVRRSICSKTGVRFSDDMITVTGNASNSIAYRNAVLSIIPKSITDRVYRAAQEVVTGDLSDETKLIAQRKATLDFFKDEYNIREDEVLKLIGKQTVNQIRSNELALLIGFYQSLKDGDTTVENLLKDVRTKADKIKNIENKEQ